MLVIDDAKLPPPSPAKAATTQKVVSEAPGCVTSHHVPRVGTSRAIPLKTAQLRPPNLAVATV